MPLVAQLKRWLLGSNLPNEYLCLKANSLPDALRAMLVIGDARIDVTDGVHPLSASHCRRRMSSQKTLVLTPVLVRRAISIEPLSVQERGCVRDSFAAFLRDRSQTVFPN